MQRTDDEAFDAPDEPKRSMDWQSHPMEDAVSAPTPSWQPVSTRRSVVPVETPPPAVVAAVAMRDLAHDIKQKYAPSTADRLVWAAAGALGMLVLIGVVRLLRRP